MTDPSIDLLGIASWLKSLSDETRHRGVTIYEDASGDLQTAAVALRKIAMEATARKAVGAVQSDASPDQVSVPTSSATEWVYDPTESTWSRPVGDGSLTVSFYNDEIDDWPPMRDLHAEVERLNGVITRMGAELRFAHASLDEERAEHEAALDAAGRRIVNDEFVTISIDRLSDLINERDDALVAALDAAGFDIVARTDPDWLNDADLAEMASLDEIHDIAERTE